MEGTVSDASVTEAYERATAFIMLSRLSGKSFEGFGLVYLEANAYGVPVIGSRASGAADAIKDGESGFLVSPDNPRETAEALRHIVLNGKMRRGASAWARAHQWNILARQYETEYYSLLPLDSRERPTQMDAPITASPSISAVTIVKNEAHNIEQFMRSIEGVADELIVVDTGSTDGTEEMVKRYAHLVSYPVHISSAILEPFHFGKAKNHAVDQATKEYILVLDADERVTASLRSGLRRFLKKTAPSIVSIPRIDELLPHYHDSQVRIWNNSGSIRYREGIEGSVHESLECAADPEFFDAPILHMQGKNHWLRRPWRIRQQLSLEIARTTPTRGVLNEVLHAPLGFFYKFRSVYIRRGAYRDGWRGFVYSFLKGIYASLYHLGVAWKAFHTL